MVQATTTPTEKAYPGELRELLERANAGDPTALPEVRRALDEHPELAALLAAGKSLVAQEAIARQVADLRQRLAATAATPLERLLADRVVISWIEVHHGDIDLAGHLLNHPGAAPTTRAAQKRLDAAHARFLSATRALAVAQKLLKPSPSALDLLARPVGETDVAGARRRSSVSPREGVPVVN
jgi:hypothetical protein